MFLLVFLIMRWFKDVFLSLVLFFLLLFVFFDIFFWFVFFLFCWLYFMVWCVLLCKCWRYLLFVYKGKNEVVCFVFFLRFWILKIMLFFCFLVVLYLILKFKVVFFIGFFIFISLFYVVYWFVVRECDDVFNILWCV